MLVRAEAGGRLREAQARADGDEDGQGAEDGGGGPAGGEPSLAARTRPGRRIPWPRMRARCLVPAWAVGSLSGGAGDPAPGAAPEAAAPAEHANVVLIVTDDQPSSTLGHMPHVQRRLVREGLLFERFFLNDPICCPSRTTLLLGQNRHNHHLETDEAGCATRFFIEGNHRQTLVRLIGAAGVRTGMVGKYLNQYDLYLDQFGDERGDDSLRLGWDDFHVSFNRAPVDFVLQENGKLVLYDSRPALYQTDALSDIALRFVRVAARNGQPFFLYIAPEAPHEGFPPAARHRELFAGEGAPRPPSFDEADVSDKASAAPAERLTEEQIAAIDGRYRGMLRALQGVDELVENLVRTLEATGQLDRTYILYASDNGYHFGEHRFLRGKGTPYEESVRAPLVVRGPGVPRGERRRQLVSNVDVFPTVVDLLGIELDADTAARVDGRSLRPLLAPGAADLPWRTGLVLESTHFLRNQGVPRFAALRTPDHKLIRYAERREWALYDLERDPYELENVYESADPALAGALRERLGALLECAGPACARLEDAPLPAAPPAAQD